MPLRFEGDRSHVAAYLEKFNATSSAVNIKTLADILYKSSKADDGFKVTFMLFTILGPPILVRISIAFYSL